MIRSMIEPKWKCERCSREYDLEEGEGWVTLVEEDYINEESKLTPLVPFDAVCYECADELLAITAKCNKFCLTCDAVTLWGLSIKDCLKFQVKFDQITLPSPTPPSKGNLEKTKQASKFFERHNLVSGGPNG